MDVINFKVFLNMTESFAQLFEESLKQLETRPGAIVKGTVVAIENGIVLVDAGLKSEQKRQVIWPARLPPIQRLERRYYFGSRILLSIPV